MSLFIFHGDDLFVHFYVYSVDLCVDLVLHLDDVLAGVALPAVVALAVSCLHPIFFD